MDATAPQWTFVVDRIFSLSFRSRPYVMGHMTSGSVQVGDWFRCPEGILGQVDSVELARVLTEREDQIVLGVDHQALREGDTLHQAPTSTP